MRLQARRACGIGTEEVGNEARSAHARISGYAFACVWRCQSGVGAKIRGTLKIGHFASPASMSMLEELTLAVNRPMSGVFNNLVIFKQDEPQNTPDSIVPELATGWTWSEDGTELPSRCTRASNGTTASRSPPPTSNARSTCCREGERKAAHQPSQIVVRQFLGSDDRRDYEVTFQLKRPQPSLLSMLATGWTPIYPCHVSPAQMRQHPIGTGPFKFVEFKPNQSITVVRNPDYWKAGRPYLDGIEYRIIQDVSTRLLSFMAGN